MAAPVKKIETLGGGKLAVIKECMLCGKDSEVIVWAEHYEHWCAGADIAACFPRLTLGQREILISGSHEKCFDEAFAEEE